MTIIHNLVFALITLLWWMEFIFFPSYQRGKVKVEQNTFRLISLAIVLSIASGIIGNRMGIGVLAPPLTNVLRFFGFYVYLVGIIIRYWSLLVLGQYFSRGIQACPQQKLVSKGPYSQLRHPLYLGLTLLTLGATLYVGNIIGPLIAIVLMFFALKKRIDEEEAFMEEIIGDPYQKWKKGRYRLLPFIY